MNLLTVDDVERHIGTDTLLQLAGIGSFNSIDGRSLDQAKVEAAMAFSDQLIASYVKRRWPLANWEPESAPLVLKGLALDIVHYRLRLESGDRNQVTEEVRKRFEWAVAWLRDLGSGKAELEGAPEAGEESPVGRVSAIIPLSPVPGILKGW